MAVSKFTSSSNVNDFNINITSTYSTVTLDREYPSGSYTIVSSVNDTTIDVYAFNSLGTLVGYTGAKAFTATAGFSKLVVLGGTTGDILAFSYKTTFTTASETAETGAGPVLLGASPTSLPNVNNSLTLTGYNFASGMSVTFTGSDSVVRGAKSVVVGSATSAIVTRPDTLPVSYSPYTLTATNPGVNAPVGTNSNILASPTITAGVNPTWVTTSGTLAAQAYAGIGYAGSVLATDADGGSSITYSVTAGALPTGLSINSTTGGFTGTSSGTPGTTYTFTARATDSGGNTADRSFSIVASSNLPVTSGLAAWFPADSWSGTQWLDVSGNNRHVTSASITGSPTLATANSNSNGASKTFPYLAFTASGPDTIGSTVAVDALNFPTNTTMGITGNNYTLFHVIRYSGSHQQRILTGAPENWLSGAWNHTNGVAFHQNWLTQQSTLTHGTNWFYSTDQNGVYRSNGTSRVSLSATFNFYSGYLSINGTEASDSNIAEVIFYNRVLNSTEYGQIETYLSAKYGI